MQKLLESPHASLLCELRGIVENALVGELVVEREIVLDVQEDILELRVSLFDLVDNFPIFIAIVYRVDEKLQIQNEGIYKEKRYRTCCT